jgi:hypothetical protein
MKSLSKITLVSLIAVMASSAHSFGLGDLKNLKTTEEATAAPAVDSYSAQEGLVKQYNKAASDITTAQQMFAEALGLKQEVTDIQEAIDALKSGSVMDKDTIARVAELSTELNEKLQAKIAEGEELSAESKKKYASAFLPLFKGLYESNKIGDEATRFIDGAQQTISSASMMNKLKVTNKLSAGMYVAKEIPGFTLNLFKTSKSLFSFAKSQSISVPADPTGEINFDT